MLKEPSPGWAWISAFQRTRNGRAAYLALTAHYLGPAHCNRQTAEANALMGRLTYTGQKNFTLDNFLGKLKNAFNTLERHNEALSENRKIQIVTERCHDPKLDSIAKVIRALPETYDTVEKAINYMLEMNNTIRRKGEMTRQIACLTGEEGDNDGDTKKNKHGNKKKGKDDDNIARNYTSTEWYAMTEEERSAVREARQAQAQKKSSKIKKRTVAKVAKANEDENEEEESEGPPAKSPAKEKEGQSQGVGFKMTRR